MVENQAEIRDLFDYLYLNRRNLSRSQLSFCESTQKQFRRDKSLSEKQITILREIKKYLPMQDARISMRE